jgi:hypothetical protein
VRPEDGRTGVPIDVRTGVQLLVVLVPAAVAAGPFLRVARRAHTLRRG